MEAVESPNTDMKRGGRGRHARGGATKDRKEINQYNAVGSPTAKEAEDQTPDFKKGGRKHRKDGGMADGGMSESRDDRPMRGRRAAGGRAGGHSPYSSGRALNAPESSTGPAGGHEGVKVADEPG